MEIVIFFWTIFHLCEQESNRFSTLLETKKKEEGDFFGGVEESQEEGMFQWIWELERERN